MPATSSSVTVTSDASGSWGCRAVTSDGLWLQLQWPQSWGNVHITTKNWSWWSLPWPCGANAGKVVQCNANQTTWQWWLHWTQGQQRNGCWCTCCVVCISSQLMPNYALWPTRSQGGWTWGQMPFCAIMLTCPFCPTVCNPAGCNTPSTGGYASTLPPRLDLTQLEADLQAYFGKALAPSTAQSYASARQHYISFCHASMLTSLPTDWTITVHVCGLFGQPRPQASNTKVLPGSFSFSGTCRQKQAWETHPQQETFHGWSMSSKASSKPRQLRHDPLACRLPV